MPPSGAGDSPGSGDSSGDNIIHANEHITPTSGERRPGSWLRRFALTSVVATFALIVLGGIVRVTGSGMGCGGEWPLCEGSLIPPLTKEDIIEYSHRLVASGIVGPLVVGTFLIALFRYRRVRSVLIPSGISVVLLLAQAGLGGVIRTDRIAGRGSGPRGSGSTWLWPRRCWRASFWWPWQPTQPSRLTWRRLKRTRRRSRLHRQLWPVVLPLRAQCRGFPAAFPC